MASRRCRFVILGSGGSCSLPNLRHVLQQQESPCPVCLDALANPESRNRRGNPCLLVSVSGDDGSEEHLLVDCGKTFEEAVRRLFPGLGVHCLNAVLLTHGHADAILGLDSLREVQLARERPETWTCHHMTPVFATPATLKEVWHHFHYMLPPDFCEPDKSAFRRRASFERIVGGLEPSKIQSFKCFWPLTDLCVQPLPVFHGGTYMSMGFAFGALGEFVYLSDVSSVPAETMAVLECFAIKVLVVDCLLKGRPNYSHFGLPQALELIRLLKPEQALLIGMSCEFEHVRDSQELQKLSAEGISVGLSSDGLVLELELSCSEESLSSEEEGGDELPYVTSRSLHPPLWRRIWATIVKQLRLGWLVRQCCQLLPNPS